MQLAAVLRFVTVCVLNLNLALKFYMLHSFSRGLASPVNIYYVICIYRMLQEENMQLHGSLEEARIWFDRHMKDVAVFAMVSRG